MKTQKVMFFTEKEQEFADLLINVGISRNTANVLVFLANAPAATSRDIERGTDLRQPEVSLAMRFLSQKDWITMSDQKKGNRSGRPNKVYKLRIPIKKIMDSIEKEKKEETRKKLERVAKLKSFI